MADLVLVDKDPVIFLPAFSPAMVVVQPGKISASGAATIKGKKICVDGDERNVSVPGCAYISGPYVIPGTGTLKIQQLAGNQKATKTYTSATLVLLRGGMFTAVFEVQSPAQQPTAAGPVPDATPKYTGQGQFVATNQQVKAS